MNITLPDYSHKDPPKEVPVSLLEHLNLLEIASSGDPIEQAIRLVRPDTTKPVKSLHTVIGKDGTNEGFVVTEGSCISIEKIKDFFRLTRAILYSDLESALVDFYGSE